MTIHFGHKNNSLVSRVLGREIRQGIEDCFNKGEFVYFDFEGVNVVSHSFADECFGNLLLTWDLDTIKQLSSFQNANDLVRKAIAFTIKEKLNKLAIA